MAPALPPERRPPADRSHFETVVVGSGFGGSVTAYRLADGEGSVCVLERGKSYPPGSFPRSPYEMARNFWDPSEGLHGMFDIWSFSGIEAVVSSGLGGGSLIYANVLLRKDRDSFFVRFPDGTQEPWPVNRRDLDPHYKAVEDIIGVHKYPVRFPPYAQTPKMLALREGADRLGRDWKPAPLGVTFANPGSDPVIGAEIQEAHPNLHHLPRSTCRLVGECDVGCNYGSKNTLDMNYLTQALERGARIAERCEVRSFEPIDGGFAVDFVHHEGTDQGRKMDTSRLPVRRITCRRLVLAAGSLGTTFLLLRNRAVLPRLSRRLGTRFSGNGDFLGLVFTAKRSHDGVRSPRILDPSFGPVITSYASDDDGEGGSRSYVEDAGYPQFVNSVIENSNPAQALRMLGFLARRAWAVWTRSPNSRIGSSVGSAFGRNLFTATSMPLLGMGHDVPDGRMRLRDGYLDVEWTSRGSKPYFDRMNGTMRAMAKAVGGRYWPDPLWWLNLLITVHPLGGCPMGTDPSRGVVDEWGRVFGYEGNLWIADGSIMPGPVGANPSLTIAALADRMCTRIESKGW